MSTIKFLWLYSYGVKKITILVWGTVPVWWCLYVYFEFARMGNNIYKETCVSEYNKQIFHNIYIYIYKLHVLIRLNMLHHAKVRKPCFTTTSSLKPTKYISLDKKVAFICIFQVLMVYSILNCTCTTQFKQYIILNSSDKWRITLKKTQIVFIDFLCYLLLIA